MPSISVLYTYNMYMPCRYNVWLLTCIRCHKCNVCFAPLRYCLQSALRPASGTTLVDQIVTTVNSSSTKHD